MTRTQLIFRLLGVISASGAALGSCLLVFGVLGPILASFSTDFSAPSVYGLGILLLSLLIAHVALLLGKGDRISLIALIWSEILGPVAGCFALLFRIYV